MGSNFHFTIDLNEDQNHQSFFSPLGSSFHHLHHQVPSYFPISTNAHLDQVPNNNAFDGFLDPTLSQTLETKKFVCHGGSSSSDQMVPKKEKRLKLTIRKKYNHQEDQFDLPQYHRKGETETNSLKWVSSKVRLMKKKTLISNSNNNKEQVNNEQSLNLSNLEGHHHDDLRKLSTNQFNDNGYNGSNNCVIRICSDCNTTKTPLWRSGPRGPKSLCNACGIRQRKARRAAMAATMNSDSSPPLLKKKMQNKNKRQNGVCNLSYPSAPKVKKYKRMIRTEEEAVKEAEPAGDLETHSKPMMPSSSTGSSNKFYFDDLDIILSKSSAYQQVFPQDEKEAAVLLMALSYGMVHG